MKETIRDVLGHCLSQKKTTSGRFLYWTPLPHLPPHLCATGLLSAVLSRADVHEFLFTCSSSELPPRNGLLEPEAVIVPCSAIKGPILV